MVALKAAFAVAPSFQVGTALRVLSEPLTVHFDTGEALAQPAVGLESALRLGLELERQDVPGHGHHLGPRKRRDQPFEPAGRNGHVVVNRNHDVAGGGGEAGVARVREAWSRLVDADDAVEFSGDGPRRARRSRPVIDDDHFHGPGRALLFDRAQAATKIVRPIAGRDDDRDADGRSEEWAAASTPPSWRSTIRFIKVWARPLAMPSRSRVAEIGPWALPISTLPINSPPSDTKTRVIAVLGDVRNRMKLVPDVDTPDRDGRDSGTHV